MMEMYLQKINVLLQQAIWPFVLFLIIAPLEIWLSKEGRENLEQRLSNITYMLIFFVVGGLILHFLKPLYLLPNSRGPLIQNPFLHALAYLAMTDFCFYVYHRLQHAIPLLWKVHRLHHSDRDMNITTSRRTNPLERGFQFFLINIPSVWLLGINPESVTYIFYASAFFLYFSHLKLNVNFGVLSRFIVTPTLHRIHHSREHQHRDRNFSMIFPILDMLGGTYLAPQKNEFPETGLSTDP